MNKESVKIVFLFTNGGVETGDLPGVANVFAYFQEKKSENAPGDRRKMIREKKLKKNISWHYPFKGPVTQRTWMYW